MVEFNSSGGRFSKSNSAVTTRTVKQDNHGFIFHFVYFYNNRWQKAVAISTISLASHFAVRVDDNNFKLYSIGDIDLPVGILDESGDSLVPGVMYYLSAKTPGSFTRTKPELAQPVIKVTDNNTATFYGKPYEATVTNTGGGDSGGSLPDPNNTEEEARVVKVPFEFTENLEAGAFVALTPDSKIRRKSSGFAYFSLDTYPTLSYIEAISSNKLIVWENLGGSPNVFNICVWTISNTNEISKSTPLTITANDASPGSMFKLSDSLYCFFLGSGSGLYGYKLRILKFNKEDETFTLGPLYDNGVTATTTYCYPQKVILVEEGKILLTWQKNVNNSTYTNYLAIAKYDSNLTLTTCSPVSMTNKVNTYLTKLKNNSIQLWDNNGGGTVGIYWTPVNCSGDSPVLGSRITFSATGTNFINYIEPHPDSARIDMYIIGLGTGLYCMKFDGVTNPVQKSSITTATSAGWKKTDDYTYMSLTSATINSASYPQFIKYKLKNDNSFSWYQYNIKYTMDNISMWTNFGDKIFIWYSGTPYKTLSVGDFYPYIGIVENDTSVGNIGNVIIKGIYNCPSPVFDPGRYYLRGKLMVQPMVIDSTKTACDIGIMTAYSQRMCNLELLTDYGD